ncbi:hypothetical protein [Nitrincola sp. A-D6]|uniref:hypothetical protein n=1 Tax=Nitrincola sp. A-D6 TaxID=1545442 RepID=UPI00056B92AA|nr:hypothetical protein [Nitrincola sp. A-D6]
MNDVKFKFDTPEHGWMDISVGDGEREESLVISDVPCNSVYKLAYILLALQSGSKSEEVEFSLEPDYALWKFRANDNELEIHVFPSSSRNNPIVFKGQRTKVIHRLYKALRDLETLSCWKEPDATSIIWSWEFPYQELNQFRARAKSA